LELPKLSNIDCNSLKFLKNVKKDLKKSENLIIENEKKFSSLSNTKNILSHSKISQENFKFNFEIVDITDNGNIINCKNVKLLNKKLKIKKK